MMHQQYSIGQQQQMGNSQNAGDASSNEVKQVYTIYSNSLISKSNLNPDTKRISKDVVKQLFQSFTRYTQYSWSEQITPLFMSYFSDNINSLWGNDKQKFYKQMLENSGLLDEMNHQKKKTKHTKNYQNQFYSCQAIKLKSQKTKEDLNAIQNNIQALNYSIVDQEQQVPFVFKKKIKSSFEQGKHRHTNGNKINVGHSMAQLRSSQEHQYLPELVHTHSSQYYDSQILRSSVIVPETIFVQRLNQQSKFKVNNMLNFYKIFSQSLQQMIRSISLMACPLKHFQISLKRKVRVKKIKSMSSNSTSSLLRQSRNTKNQALLRKKQQYNNTFLLVQIRDFTDAYTQFIWKYLNLYRISETQFSNFITIETAYGVVLKLVWTFTSWIGERGYDWQQKQIPFALKKLSQQQEAQEKQNKKYKKVQIFLQKDIINLGYDLSTQTNPQKYLKKIVIIYRQLSRKCTNADQLILYYEAFFQQIAKLNACQRLFRMQMIIDKLLKMEDSCGQICYAWTTWNIMVETVKKIITDDSKQKQADEDFKKFLSEVQKSRLSH